MFQNLFMFFIQAVIMMIMIMITIFANMIMQKCMLITVQAVIMMITIMQIHIDHFAGGA